MNEDAESGGLVRTDHLDASRYHEFYAMITEYLPGSNLQKVKARQEAFPQTFLVQKLTGQLIGIAYGWPRKLDDPQDPSFVLDGIAVKAEYWRRGFGTRLLNAFADAAKSGGFSVISVGSADGYAEKFYMHNGFVPKKYRIYDGNQIVTAKEFVDLADYYRYQRPQADGFVVMEKRIE